MKNKVRTLNIMVIARMSGYFGIPKGINNAPHTVFIVDKNNPNSPAHKNILILGLDLSYNAPKIPKAIINYE